MNLKKFSLADFITQKSQAQNHYITLTKDISLMCINFPAKFGIHASISSMNERY